MSEALIPIAAATSPAAPPASSTAARADTALGKDPLARKPTAPDLLQVAQEFESLLLSMLMKSMRATVPHNDLLGNSSEVRTYQELQDQETAMAMARSGGLGLAPLIVQQLASDPQAAAQARGALATAHDAGRRALVDSAMHALTPDLTGAIAAPNPPVPSSEQEDSW